MAYARACSHVKYDSAWSALENRALRCSVGDEMRDWKEAIQEFFATWDGADGCKN